VPLLSVDYALPLDVDNHPDRDTATFTVRQTHAVPAQEITTLKVWTSVDDGKTWTPAGTTRSTADIFTARLPVPAAGQFVSLRVEATGSAGSGIDQTIIRAYRGA
jgi:hypothetical protein